VAVDDVAQAERNRRGFSGISITSFVLSLAGFLFALTAIPALVLGIIDLARSSRTATRRGLSIAAIAISAAWIAIFGALLFAASNDQDASSTDDRSRDQQTEEVTTEETSASTPTPNPPDASPTQAEDSSTVEPTPVEPEVQDPETAFLEEVRSSGPIKTRQAIEERKDARLLRAGRSACEQIQSRGSLTGYGMYYGSQVLPPDESPWVAQAAVTYLCPDLGVDSSEIAGFRQNFDRFVVDLASEEPFARMLAEAREQGGVGPSDDDENLMKDAFMFCAILNAPKPWRFFEALDGMQPTGSTPSLLEYRGILNSSYFYVCPDIKFSPEDVARKWADRNL